MIPDINLKGYYLQFINNAQLDIDNYNKSIEDTEKIKENLHDYISEHADVLKAKYSIDLNKFGKEWIYKVYNDAEQLYTKVIKLVNVISDESIRIVLIQIVKYCNALKSLNKYEKLIKLAKVRSTIKFGTYTKYVMNYYNGVHKVLLQGMGYRYLGGIGTFSINFWKIDPSKAKKTKRIDFAATNLRKKELLAQGKTLYDDKVAAWYKARNIPYDGVDYRIYKDESHFYDFAFMRSTLFTSSSVDYKRTEYVGAKYRGMSYTKISDDHCNSIDDICNLQVDIKYKLNILLHKDPTKYLNFIRNAEQCKYKRGAHSR